VRRALALAILLSLLAPANALGADGRAEGQLVHLQHQDWPLPAWTADGPAVWTTVGAPYASSVALIGADGSFAPRNHGPAVSFWLYDLDAAVLVDPAQHTPRLRLDDDYLPIVSSAWDAGDLHVETTYFTGWPGGNVATWFSDSGAGSDQAVTFIRMIISTTALVTRHLAVFVAIRPFGVERDTHAIDRAGCTVGTATLVADGAVVLTGLQPAGGCGANALADGDVGSFALQNMLPRAPSISDPGRRAAAMLRLEATLSPGAARILEFRAPAARLEPTPDRLDALIAGSFERERVRVADAWRTALNRTSFDVSDSRFNSAFRASQAYLLLNRRGPTPRSGPLAHDAFWVRDAAYVGQALERVGYAAENGTTLEALARTQREDGSFPAITDVGGARPVDEWDAQGQAIAALVAHYRFGHDKTWLAQVYPGVAAAARFLDALRGRTLGDDRETRSLLPANLSAEDLGPATWHHYWDDLWAISGYREAAYAARELGVTSDAVDFDARAQDLQANVLQSISLVQARAGIAYVPNGPEDVNTSAMARGTTPALWPVRSLQGVPAQDLLSSSFRTYDQLWLEPQSGGYRHVEGTLWPYGGLGIAHAMLRLGLLQPTWQILDWTLGHQTLPGTYAWGEGINPTSGGLELGDMPHSWAAAEFICLLRDLVIAEQDGWLQVNSGIPDNWLEPGKHVILRDAPTEYGPVTVTLVRAATSVSADLTVTVDGAPPLGWRIRLIGTPAQITIDGNPSTTSTTAGLQLPSGPHVIRISYAMGS
jgi:hypothetical protein